MRYRGKYEAPPQKRSARRKVSIHFQMMVTSAVSFVLCCSMLLGTTMAWFTDTVTSTANQITIGKLEVDVFYAEHSLRSTDTAVFGGPNDTTVWSPGMFQIKELTVVNQGTLDLNYVLSFLSDKPNNTAFNHFEVYVKEGSVKDTNPGIADIQDSWKRVGTLYDILNTESIYVFKGELKAGTSGSTTQQVYSIALYMPTGITDDSIQGANLKLNIQLHAYQTTATQETTPATTEAETPSQEAPADPAE